MTLVIDQAAPAACRRLETTEQDLSAIDQQIGAFLATALHRSDLITSTHRPHGHFLAKALLYYAPEGYDPLRDPLPPELQEVVYRTLAEIMGLRDGWCGGRGGSMHLCDPRSGNLGSNGIVGGGIPLATGIAWAQKLQKKDTIVVSFFGDGAINQGCFHEVANMAALWGLPVLYLVENNHYAVGTRTDESSYVHPGLWLRQPDRRRHGPGERVPGRARDGSEHAPPALPLPDRGQDLPFLSPRWQPARQRLRLPDQSRGGRMAGP